MKDQPAIDAFCGDRIELSETRELDRLARMLESVQGRLTTRLSRSPPASRAAGVGHQDAFLRPRLSARCHFS